MDGLTPVGQVDGLLAPRNSMTYKSLGPNDRPRSSRQNLGSNDRLRSSRHKKSSTDLGKEGKFLVLRGCSFFSLSVGGWSMIEGS